MSQNIAGMSEKPKSQGGMSDGSTSLSVSAMAKLNANQKCVFFSVYHFFTSDAIRLIVYRVHVEFRALRGASLYADTNMRTHFVGEKVVRTTRRIQFPFIHSTHNLSLNFIQQGIRLVRRLAKGGEDRPERRQPCQKIM